jgi:hypothetical protein
LNSRRWNREVEILNSWIPYVEKWIHGVKILNSRRWNRKFIKLKCPDRSFVQFFHKYFIHKYLFSSNVLTKEQYSQNILYIWCTSIIFNSFNCGWHQRYPYGLVWLVGSCVLWTCHCLADFCFHVLSKSYCLTNIILYILRFIRTTCVYAKTILTNYLKPYTNKLFSED